LNGHKNFHPIGFHLEIESKSGHFPIGFQLELLKFPIGFQLETNWIGRWGGESLEQGLILQNLEQLHFNNVFTSFDDESQCILDIAASNWMLRSLIDHCPKLSTVALKIYVSEFA
jgi:hypothetical protein